MKGDFSRRTFDKEKHYSSVLMQQGRVQVDSDWNEQQAIHQYRHETQTCDAIGLCGAPKPEHGGGFEITPTPDGSDIQISRGRIYVDGILCENDRNNATLSKQDDLPMKEGDLAGLALPSAAGRYLVYLDVWQRHITAIDDPDIRETALGGPDTATRAKTVWQVKLHPAESDAECGTLDPAWKLDATGSGKMSAHTVSTGADTRPCVLSPTAGFSRLENQLYRVEIHRGTDPEDATVKPTFKWSRDNGSVVTSIKVDEQTIKVADTGRDEVIGFAHDQWVEILDDRMELADQRGHLVQIDTVNPATREITIKTATPLPVIDETRHPKLRRWDQSGATADGVEITTDEILLEDGIEVQFSGDTYRSGDYWLIPARTAISSETGSIGWEGVQSPHGIHHHYCPLALVDFNGSMFESAPNSDCRHLFPPLTDITADDVRFDNNTCQLPNAETVQDALDALCNYKEEPGIHITKVLKGDPAKVLCNYTEVAVHELVEGLRIVCDREVDHDTIEGKPTCYVTLYMPFPFNSADRELWGDQVLGFQPLILAADAKSDGAVIYWNPTDATGSWLKSRLLGRMEKRGCGDRVLASLTLEGNFIWADKDHSLYLDGEAFGVPENHTESGLDLPSGNGRRGGDFEIWFWLVRETGTVEYIEYNVSKEKDLIVVNGLCTNNTKNCETQNGISGGRYYAKVGAHVAVNGNPKIRSELILEQTVDERQTLTTGEPWELGGGYSLVAQQIDLEGDKVWLSLQKDGKEIDNEVVDTGSIYVYSTDIAGETDVPMFVTYVDAIFRGTDSNIVQLCYTWLISDEVEETGTVEYVEYNVSKEKDLIVVNGLCTNNTKNCETQNGISGGRYYAKVGAHVAVNGNPKIRSELILEQTADEMQTLATGEPWELGGGYSLVAQQIDLEGDKVWLELQRYGAEIDNAVVEAGRDYTRVVEHIEGETDVPMFVTYVKAIFSGTRANMMQLCYTWLISDDVETIE